MEGNSNKTIQRISNVQIASDFNEWQLLGRYMDHRQKIAKSIISETDDTKRGNLLIQFEKIQSRIKSLIGI